jgi:hypothetical protein
MIELTVVAVVGLALLMVFLAVAVISLVVRGLFWLVLLPLRIIFAVLFLPLLLIKALVGGLLFLILGPLLAVASIVAALVLAAMFALPLAPVLLLLFAIWMVTRSRRPALVRS